MSGAPTPIKITRVNRNTYIVERNDYYKTPAFKFVGFTEQTIRYFIAPIEAMNSDNIARIAMERHYAARGSSNITFTAKNTQGATVFGETFESFTRDSSVKFYNDGTYGGINLAVPSGLNPGLR
jgi:hypothetical protein